MNDKHDNFKENIPAYMLGALDREEARELERHAEGCKLCRNDLGWLTPAIRALPETVDRQTPAPELRERVMAEVRSDVAAAAAASGAKREERSPSLGERLRGLHLGGLTWKPLAGMAAVVLIVAAFAGYEVGDNGGGGGGTTGTTRSQTAVVGRSKTDGVTATVVRNGDRGSIRLAGVKTLPKGRVLEAWLQRGEDIRPVRALFVPDPKGNAATTIANLEGVEKILVTREPAGGTKAPTSTPIAAVDLD